MKKNIFKIIALNSTEPLFTKLLKSGATKKQTYKGGSQATVLKIELPRNNPHFSREHLVIKYLEPSETLNPEKEIWAEETKRLSDEKKAYLKLADFPHLSPVFANLLACENINGQLILYIEFVGDTQLADFLKDPTEQIEALEVQILSLIDKISRTTTESKKASQNHNEATLERFNTRRKKIQETTVFHESVETLKEKVQGDNNPFEIFTQIIESKPQYFHSPTATLPTDITALNIIFDSELEELGLKIVDPGTFQETTPAYPLSKLLVYGIYFKWISEIPSTQTTQTEFTPKYIQITEEQKRKMKKTLLTFQNYFVPGKNAKLPKTFTDLTQSHPYLPFQIHFLGLAQFGADLYYRLNQNDLNSGKTATVFNAFEKAMAFLEKLINDTGSEMAKKEQKQTAQNFIQIYFRLRTERIDEELQILNFELAPG